ncbi:MAG: porin family protein [Flavobacteriales bacterium]
MKKIALFTLFAVSTILTNAQDFQKFKIAFRVSPGTAWMKPDSKYITNEGNVLRFGFGISLDRHFTENYAFGTGLEVTRMGGSLSYLQYDKYNSVDYIMERKRDYRLQYVEVPLTLKLRTNEIGYMTYWAQFGIIPGVNISAKADDEIDFKFEKYVAGTGEVSFPESDEASIMTEDEDIKDDIQIFRVGLLMAAGVEYSLSGNTAVVAGITYNNGFTNVLNGELVTTNDADKVIYDGSVPKENKMKAMSNMIQLNVGIKF